MLAGPASETIADWGEQRERRFRRLLLGSLAVHALLLGVVMVAPTPSLSPILPGVISVDLVASLPGTTQPAPAPVARPKPKPPVPEKVVLPDKVRAKPKPKPKAKAKPEATAKPKPKPDPIRDQGYDDVLAQLRAEAGAVAPAPVAGGGARGRGVRVSPEELAWIRRAKMHVTRAWVLAPGFRTLRLETHVSVRLGSAGQVLGTQLERRSGNPWFDESVERAIRKASPLPAPPKAAEWTFVFRPEDLL